MRRIARENLTRLLSLFVLVVLVLAMCAGGNFSTRAYADTGDELNFDKTNVLDDLGSSTIDGKPFNLNDYPKNPYGKVEVLSFIEYCYAFADNNNGNYALYLYLYNPACLNILTASTANKIQIATDFFYEGEKGTVGEPQSYSKFTLQFCSMSTGEYEKLFYKFRVVDENNVILNAVRTYEKAFGGTRLYAISGVELVEEGAAGADDIMTINDKVVGKRYTYSGYAEGYGNSDDFPLSCSVDDLETVELEVHSTFYRPDDEVIGEHGMTQDQLNSVYFAVPNSILTAYGGLQKVRAEWWEYKTQPIIITESKELYDALNAFIGVNIGSYNSDVGFALSTDREIVAGSGDLTSHRSDWGYNIPDDILLSCRNEVSALYYLFNTFSDETSEYLALDEFILTGERLEAYVNAYNKSYENGTLDVDGKSISADLFTGDIDDRRKEEGYQVGHNDVTIDKDEVYNILSYEDTTPWWQIWGASYESSEFASVKAIEEITAEAMKLSKQEFCDTYLINYDDYDEFTEFYNEATTLDPQNPDDEMKTVFVFRFSQTEYYSRSLEVGYYRTTFPVQNSGWVFNYTTHPTGYAQSTVFLNFDIIELTFLKDGVFTVIPAVSDPIDIYSDIEVPKVENPGLPDWLKIVLAVLALIVLLVILMPILPYIIKAVVWVILLPFRLIAAIVKGIQKAAKKKPKQTDVSPPKAVQAKPPKASKRKY